MTEKLTEKPRVSISFSEYSTFQQCPHKWFLNYILKVPGDTNEELIFGSSVHDTIESILTNKIMSKMVFRDPSMVEPIFKDNLKKQIKDIKDIVMLRKMSEGWVAPTFVKQARELIKELNLFTRFADYEIMDVEIQLDGLPIIETDDVILTYKGFIDLVLKNKKTGRYLIIDWKTSRKAWDIAKKEIDHNFYTQLKLYKHFYSIKKNIPIDTIDLAFYNLPREVPKEQKRYDKHFSPDEVAAFIEQFALNCEKMYNFNHFKMDKAKFVTKKNFCHRCPYNNAALCNDTDQFQLVGIQNL